MGIFNNNKSDNDEDIFSDLMLDEVTPDYPLVTTETGSEEATQYFDDEQGFEPDTGDSYKIDQNVQAMDQTDEYQSNQFINYLTEEPQTILPIEEPSQMAGNFAHSSEQVTYPIYADMASDLHPKRDSKQSSSHGEPVRGLIHEHLEQPSHERESAHSQDTAASTQERPAHLLGERQLLPDTILQNRLRNPFPNSNQNHPTRPQGATNNGNTANTKMLVAPLENDQKTDYGINAAIELVRQLPDTGDLTVLMKVVKKTLETTGINTSDIINDANHKKATIDVRMKKLKDEIHSLEAEIRTRNLQMETLVRDFRETEQVQELLELAELPQPTKFSRDQSPPPTKR